MKHEARMAELADAHGLGPCTARCAGSSPVPGTSLPELVRIAPPLFQLPLHDSVALAGRFFQPWR